MIQYSIDFEKLRLQNIFRLLKAQSRDCKNSPSMKSVLEKLRFRGGLVYTLGLTVEKKARSEIPPVSEYGRGLALEA